MAAIAKTRAGNAAGSADRRQLIMLAGLSVVLLVLLVWQVPKLLGGSGSSSLPTPAASSVVTPAAAPATTAPAQTSAMASTPAARRTARWIKHQPARDPFVPLAVGLAAT